MPQAVRVHDRDVVGDGQFIDRVEFNKAALQRTGEGPGMAGDDAIASLHPHAHDVDELGVLGEQLADVLSVLRIEGVGECRDDVARRGEVGHALSSIPNWPVRLIVPSLVDDCLAARISHLRLVVGTRHEFVIDPALRPVQMSADHRTYPEMRVSHESIYLALFVQYRGALRKELTSYLRTGRAQRRPAGLSVNNGQDQLRGVVHISERPAEDEDRAVPGHWEGDLIFGKSYSAIATLVDRKTRFVMLVRLPHRNTADAVADALAEAVVTLPEQLRRSFTWDQGKEMAEHARFSVASGVPVYFCDPRSPWQRGSNENTNGLLRQYFPNAAPT